SQRAGRSLRRERGWQTPLQIGASMRDASQVAALAGLDVYTLPTKVAADFQALAEQGKVTLRDETEQDPEVQLNPGTDLRRTGLAALWEIDDRVRELAERAEALEAERRTGAELIALAEQVGCPVVRRWSPEERAAMEKDGKIP